MSKEYRVRCKGLDEEGRGVVEFNGRKFVVKGLLPGELATMELVYRAKETGAKLCKVLEPSAERAEPACPVFDKCGGCQLLHMSEKAQAEFKQGICEKLLGSFGKVRPILTAENSKNYRNKIHAAFAKKHVGAGKESGLAKGDDFGKKKSFGKGGREIGRSKIISGIFEEESHRVIETTDCLIQDKRAAEYLNTVRKLMQETHTEPYNEDTGRGTLRYVFLRTGRKSGEVLMALVTGTSDFPARARFAAELKKRHPEIVTLLHNINPQKNSMVLGKKETVLYGKGYITDTLCGHTFRISANSFYQVNSEQTERLYKTAVELAGITKADTVIDAYCGIGTISLMAADYAGKVIGVEVNARAVKDAVENAKRNHCTNVEFICQDAGVYMREQAAKGLSPQVVIMDPPRAGSDDAFLTALVTMAPERIVYISCNPETQARDLKKLTANGYKAEVIQPVDMFPGTKHVETCVLLGRKSDEYLYYDYEP
ncbi:MAG: 23S rRNA (uracil(1939)-C(5))-methyltransferase RlmD [Lachnospiraceae bacterium]|nr:23S rRNA (uracil(1939)-C(5))-methyltransferase RlmD [Lachnospiraceae bacterium]